MNTDDAAWRQGNPRFMITKSYRTIDVHLFSSHPRDTQKVLIVSGKKPLEIEECDEGSLWNGPPPFLRITHEQARSLFDALWFDLGLRPEKNEVGSELNATRKHLADMRVLAFGRINLAEDSSLSHLPK